MADHIKSLSVRDFNIIAEAKRNGHKFIKVLLHPRAIKRGEGPVRFTGCVELKGFKSGMGAKARYSFKEIRGGTFSFNYDEQEREYVCYLFDDAQAGPYSPIGFNRDMLAGHLGLNMFIVKDPTVYLDIKRRRKWLDENIESIRAKKKERQNNFAANSQLPSASDNISDIDKQIEFLKNKKNRLEVFENSKDEEQKKLDEVYEQTITQEQRMIDEQMNQDKIKTLDTEPVPKKEDNIDSRYVNPDGSPMTRQQKAAVTKRLKREEEEAKKRAEALEKGEPEPLTDPSITPNLVKENTPESVKDTELENA